MRTQKRRNTLELALANLGDYSRWSHVAIQTDLLGCERSLWFDFGLPRDDVWPHMPRVVVMDGPTCQALGPWRQDDGERLYLDRRRAIVENGNRFYMTGLTWTLPLVTQNGRTHRAAIGMDAKSAEWFSRFFYIEMMADMLPRQVDGLRRGGWRCRLRQKLGA